MLVENPVLTGFNADPSIIRVGKDYYIATSTFEWFQEFRFTIPEIWLTGNC